MELSHDLRRVTRQLSLRQQQVIELRAQGFTVAETAERLGIAPGTVGATTTTALRRLKRIMTEQGGEEENA